MGSGFSILRLLVTSLLASVLISCSLKSDLLDGDEKVLIGGNLALTPGGSLNYLAGETIQFSASGGASYTWSDGGSGLLNLLNRQYVIPLGTSPTTDTVQVTDQDGNSVTANIKIRAFEAKQNSVASGVNGNFASGDVELLTDHKGDLYKVVIVVAPSGGVAKPSFLAIMKSLDGGQTWAQVSTLFQPVSGKSANLPKLKSDGTNLYIFGTIGAATNMSRFFVSKSTDDGATWTLQTTFSLFAAASQTLTSIDLTSTSDGHVLLSGYGSVTGPTQSTSFLKKCNATTWVCTNPIEFTTNTTMEKITPIVKDANGHFYVGLKTDIGGSMLGDVRVYKSTNNGTTWSTLYNSVNDARNIRHVAVSDDGQSILYVGVIGASSPVAFESLDGGATWSSQSAFCAGWAVQTAHYNSAKDAVLSCYNFSAGYTSLVYKKLQGSGTWTQVLNLPGNFDLGLVQTAGGVLYHVTDQTLYVSSDFGDTWTLATKPSVTTPFTGADSEIMGIVSATPTTLYSVGYEATGTSTYSSAKVYKSTDSGTTWSSDLAVSSGFTSKFVSITKSPVTQNLIALGLQDSSTLLAYKYDSVSNVWGVSEAYTSGTFFQMQPASVVADSNGVFYSIGSYANTTTYRLRWLVRASADDGSSWYDVLDFTLDTARESSALGATVSGTDLYVVGYGVDSSNASHWLVRHYDGTTWTTIDDDRLTSVDAAATGAKARGVYKASNGTLYVVGEYLDSTFKRHWVVKSKPALGSWSVIDNVQISASYESAAYTVTEDLSGLILVSGYTQDSTGLQSAVTRVLRDGVWKTVGQYLDSSLGNIHYSAPCLTDQICTVGSSLNNEYMYRGFVRILSP